MAVIRDLDLLKDINILYKSKVIIYGAGNFGKMAVQMLENAGLKIYGFCDSDTAKWGKQYYKETYSVIAPFELSELYKSNKKEYVVIIAINNAGFINEVLETLDQYNLGNIECYTYFALKYTIELHVDDARIPESYRRKVCNGKKIYKNYIKIYNEELAIDAIYQAIYHDAVWVHQPGKVGSTSVCASLDKYGISNVKIHEVATTRDIYDDMSARTPELQECIKILQTAEMIRVIALVREPITRDIAEYFQNFADFAKYDTHIPDLCKGVVDFLDRRSGLGKMGYEFEWFNREIKAKFGIDIFNYSFDMERGFSLIKERNIELLVLKMEKLNECEDIIGQFVGVEKFRLVSANIGNEKIYRYAYKELKQKVKIPHYIVERYYQNNLGMDFFYSQTEKETFLDKLKDNIVKDGE